MNNEVESLAQKADIYFRLLSRGKATVSECESLGVSSNECKKIISRYPQRYNLCLELAEREGLNQHPQQTFQKHKDEIYNTIAGGGTIMDICHRFNISTFTAVSWLHSDEQRYTNVLSLRANIRVDAVYDNLELLADKDISLNYYRELKDFVKWSSEFESKNYYRRLKEKDTAEQGETYLDFLKDLVGEQVGKQDRSCKNGSCSSEVEE